ncbi:MAG TPA: D-glycero-beta-D-manno-heptose-7-phosphate kinase [Flavobacteriales bacterium]|jgi:rfaE bifunctional protein kinase chain/domain|nr:D-glycero-beta-D-manno-heptose-7-phosphate kinase [Flavobacteriales bacterium]HIO59584.1 D-glycero-beta-D-manno-heptose-7-phosphate kinase [Flavobacteriales bacterium]
MTKTEALKNISNLSALVVGDVMIDAYLYGVVERMSPEAPVPVVLMNGRDERAGGAANVARNVQALGASVHIATVVGDDAAGTRLIDLFQARQMGITACLRSPDRITTIKTRIIRDNEHMLRVDEETEEEISNELSKNLLASCISILDNFNIDVIIFEDYDKGVLTPDIIAGLTLEARKRDIPVTVDPKLKGFLNYPGVDLFKPNLNELREGLSTEINLDDNNFDSLKTAVQSLHEKVSPKISLTTLGSYGVWVYSPELKVDHLHTAAIPCNVIDVSGAGDTVIATASLMLASGATPEIIAEVANLAGAQVCTQSGVVTVDLELLINES